jgi:hypothetical protein
MSPNMKAGQNARHIEEKIGVGAHAGIEKRASEGERKERREPWISSQFSLTLISRNR